MSDKDEGKGGEDKKNETFSVVPSSPTNAEDLSDLQRVWVVGSTGRQEEVFLSGINPMDHVLPRMGVPYPWKDSIISIGQLAAETELQRQIIDLKEQLEEEKAAALNAHSNAQKFKENIEIAEATNKELSAKISLSFLLNRVREDAKPLLLESNQFRDLFLKSATCEAFVMSVDIRRSTDLMLKAKTPRDFASFITVLCDQLRQIVVSNLGVFDKFTGDGVLCFFPRFYSGEQAGLRAVKTAEECHGLFKRHYQESRGKFGSLLKDVGLGIGIDYGDTHLVQVGDGLTVVGQPVVYACRMSSCPAGTTVLNQPSYDEIFRRDSAFCTFEETEFSAKHEGAHIGYAVKLNGKELQLSDPNWVVEARDLAKPAKPKSGSSGQI